MVMENHAADNLFGCTDLLGFEGIKGHASPNDPADPSTQKDTPNLFEEWWKICARVLSSLKPLSAFDELGLLSRGLF